LQLFLNNRSFGLGMIRAATSEKFRGGQKSLLGTIMTSSMCSQPWSRAYASGRFGVKTAPL